MESQLRIADEFVTYFRTQHWINCHDNGAVAIQDPMPVVQKILELFPGLLVLRQGTWPGAIRNPRSAILEMLSASNAYVSSIIIEIVASSTKKLEFQSAYFPWAIEEDELADGCH